MVSTIDLMKAHRSVRKFSAAQVGDEIVVDILEAARWASTSCHLQPYTVIQIENVDDKRKFSEIAGQQAWVHEAPVFLIFCGDISRASRVCARQQVSFKGGFVEQLIFASVDTAMFAQNAILAAESLGLGGVFIGGIRNEIEEVSKVLELPDFCIPLFGLCLGYPGENQTEKPRLPVSVTLMRNRYNCDDEAEQMADYDAEILAYYAGRTSNKTPRSWSEMTINRLSKEDRPHMAEYLRQKKIVTR